MTMACVKKAKETLNQMVATMMKTRPELDELEDSSSK